MISKKMRNISMVCLSLVLALSLAFGLSSFSSIKKADAASVTIDATNWTVGGKGSISNGQFTTTATSSGSSNNATLESVDSYSNITQISITINVPNTYLAGKISINGTSVKTIKKNDYTKGDHVIVISNPSPSTGKVKLDFYGDGNKCVFVVKSIDITTAVAAETYDVTFNKNTEDTVANMPNGTDITKIPNTTPLRAGYTFVKWNTNADGSGTDYSLGATVSDNLTLYAIWQQSESESTFITKALPEGDILGQITESTENIKITQDGNETLLDGAIKAFGGGSGNTQYKSTQFNLGGKSSCIAFYLSKPAIVTLKFSGTELKLISDDNYGANFTQDTAAVGSAEVLFSSTTETKLYLEAGNYRIVNTNSSTTAKNITKFNIKYYTYIGKINNADAYAKAEYLGASFKTTGASIRYGFILEIVDINGAALDDTTLATLKSSVTGKFIFTTSQANEIVVKNLGAGTVTSSGVQKTGIIANLVITNMVESQYTAKTTTSISLTINGVEFTANSGAAASAQEKAQAAYNADLISDAVAGNFGITSKTNTDANE